MRRSTSAVIGAVLALTGAFTLLAPSPVAAQTGYPPAVCNILVGSQTLGDIRVGQQFTFQLAPVCVFAPGGTVNVIVNGASFTQTVNNNNFVDINVNVVSQTQLLIKGPVPAKCGINTITGTGPSTVAGGKQVTQTATFNLLCDGVAKPAVPVRGRLSLTGASVLPWAAGALALLMAGTLLTAAGRRRASARS